MSTLDRGVEKGRREKWIGEGRAIVNSRASWITPRNQSLSGDGPDGVPGRSDRSKSGDAHSPERDFAFQAAFFSASAGTSSRAERSLSSVRRLWTRIDRPA